jgi:hypothetical protein
MHCNNFGGRFWSDYFKSRLHCIEFTAIHRQTAAFKVTLALSKVVVIRSQEIRT